MLAAQVADGPSEGREWQVPHGKASFPNVVQKYLSLAFFSCSLFSRGRPYNGGKEKKMGKKWIFVWHQIKIFFPK